MHVHILGVCGTFMGGVAALARAAGHTVTGSDRAAYPPMSSQLEALGVRILALDDPGQFADSIDTVVVGNIMSRGMPAVEQLLDSGLTYCSGPEWLARHVLAGRRVMAVAGTHGKTTTSSLAAWLLHSAGLAPGFLIGGVPANFSCSARLGDGDWFVVEADEYDTAFFDKRPKFIHYRPEVLVLNNLEFDHADIYPDIDAISRQFSYLLRCVPGKGLVASNRDDALLSEVVEEGCYSRRVEFGSSEGSDWQVQKSGAGFDIRHAAERYAVSCAVLPGRHNALNAAGAAAAATFAGCGPAEIGAGLAQFKGVRRRNELLASVAGIEIYDDFAHHPTAIVATLHGLAPGAGRRLLAVADLRSNSMRGGAHRGALGPALAVADLAFCHTPADMTWNAAPELAAADVVTSRDPAALVALVADAAREGDRIVIMSNGGFGGFHDKLIAALEKRGQGCADNAR